MEISELKNYEVTRSFTEKLSDVFFKKSEEIYSRCSIGRLAGEAWEDYLRQFKEIEHIKKLSRHAESIDHLLEAINTDSNRYVIRDPMDNNSDFIIIQKDFAEKVVVLGHLP